MRSATDDEQINLARREERVIVTQDDDFLALAAEHHGIACCHVESRSIGEIIAARLLVRDCLSANEVRNHVEFL